MDKASFEEKEVRIKNIKIAKSIWPFIRPYFRMLCFGSILVFLSTFFELLIPYLIGMAFDGFIAPATSCKGIILLGFKINSFMSFCVIFSAFILVLFIFDFSQSIFMEYTGQRIILNLRCFLFSHMSFLPVAFYDRNSSGRLVARVLGDIENMNEMFTSVVIFIIKDILLMAGILIILFIMNIKLAFYLSFLVPIIILSISAFSKIMRKIFRTMRQKIAEINHSFSEAITGIKIIQTNSAENIFTQRFEHLNSEYFKASLSQIRIFSTFMPFIGFLGIVSIAIIIYAGSFEIINKAMTLGELVAFLTYMKLFFRPLRELSEKFNLLQNALSSTERIVKIIDTKAVESQVNINGKKNDIKRIMNIEFKDVSFSYKKGNRVLKDISFSLDKGESIGIVGRTGAGKSSIINLITGFYPVDSGKILFNNMDRNCIDIKAIRKKIALVMQDSFLFSGTIRENIRPDVGHIDDLALKEALKKAECDFLFSKFAGLDTIIKEGGRPLSSGEKQLVCIARAFAFNPDLIIFDEATSYMDSQSEQKIHYAMKKLMKGRLAIIIAHRLSTVKICNKILVLRNGCIIEQGSHNELVKLRGEYYHLLEKERI